MNVARSALWLLVVLVAAVTILVLRRLLTIPGSRVAEALPESAWNKFEQVCEQAEGRRYYMTSDIAGRAVELLAPRLDPEQLVRRALSTVRSTSFYAWYRWDMNGKPQFGYADTYNSRGLHAGARRITGAWQGTGSGHAWLSPADYAVAHAVWELDAILDARDDTTPNVIENELVPAFVAANFNNPNVLRLAAAIGGPHIEQYLLRRNWQAEPEALARGEHMSIHGRDVNSWRYLLAHLQSPAGREFRRENDSMLMEMADVLAAGLDMRWQDELNFLFLDNELGDESLAMKYWPRFRTLPTQPGRYALLHQFLYLVHMEPLSTVDMYVQCWRSSRGDYDSFLTALDHFDELPLERGKREQIHAALRREIETTLRNVTNAQDTHRVRELLLSDLKSELLPPEDTQIAEEVIAELRNEGPRYKPDEIATWLANARPQGPLLDLLADATEPELRLLVMGGLREHPTPANRQRLEELLQDDNTRVRAAAQEVRRELAELGRLVALQLAAGPHGKDGENR